MLKETKIIGFNCAATCFWISFWNEVHTRHHCSLWMNQLNCKTLTLAYGIFNWSLKRCRRCSVSVKHNFQSELVKGMIVTDEWLVGAKPVERANQNFFILDTVWCIALCLFHLSNWQSAKAIPMDGQSTTGNLSRYFVTLLLKTQLAFLRLER